MKWIESLTGNYSSSASVVDGTLIISLPQAITPVVWRMDLGHARASALEVRSLENGTHVLTLKTPKGDVHDIAPFAQRGKAIEALMAVSRAMEQAQGQIRPIAANMPEIGTVSSAAPVTSGKNAKRRPLTGIIGTLLLLGLIIVLFNMGPKSPGIPATEPVADQPPAATGVPLSADDFLNNR
ncbi:MAG: hypothetical protein HYS17_02685 [Micavibrio aeruginosavorus]|uniref:Uncharacterized protein n=1 Tax=Micavibrio aeruginosavorus TaxID=349221 RepID=A0A7T5R3D8_9BACT|nr:MAG: hypothetical protein HYS17_02685 [Micavibrio aeruginosavorus]